MYKLSVSSKWLILATLSASLLVAGCGNKNNQDNTKADTANAKELNITEDKKEAAIPVEIATVTRGEIHKTYQTITTLEAENEVNIVSRSSGILEKVIVEEGEHVSKGQILAQLDVGQLALELQQTKASLDKLKNESERQAFLYKKHLASDDNLDRSRFDYAAQQAQYDLAKLKFEYATIRSPIDGVITKRSVKQGNLIQLNSQLFTVIDPNSIKAILYLPEKELQQVHPGQKLSLSVDSFADRIIPGEVERIRPTIDTETGTFKVTARINNLLGKLKPGMFGRAELVFDIHSDSLLISEQAIITQDNRSHVFVVKDNKAMQTPITLGIRNNGMVEITKGVNESDKIIISGQQILKNDASIEIING
ncbi:MAG: efflux transporter periplasmic adaptor subunit [Gammaproteobacteria bacterium CG22_combo_CG10-13_8_21_14_all_40_8]|nr:MAG: efflux transporter periplasmic adaptor subunit [Gammaproteobacteria bacterium CG22_combo_CG10-13_8_21_14_all_40_8]